MRKVQNLIVAVLAGVVIACTDGALPTDPTGESPSFGRANKVNTDYEVRHAQLKDLQVKEKDRIKQDEVLLEPEFLAAYAEWEANKSAITEKTSLDAVALLRCPPQRYEGKTAIVGPAGGTLWIGDHVLLIPKNALAQEELIVAEAMPTSLVELKFQPEGLLFQQPAKLSLSYKGCEIPTGFDMRLAYLGTGNEVLELPPSWDWKSYWRILGEIRHFSRYAVAY